MFIEDRGMVVINCCFKYRCKSVFSIGDRGGGGVKLLKVSLDDRVILGGMIQG